MVSMTIIPHDIIRDILCRLPTETLAQFRCVSKEWLSLLSEPRFMQTHQKTLNRNHLIFWSNDGSLNSVPCKTGSTVTKLHLGCYHINVIFGSVNGLVLAWAYRNLHKDYALVVLNPTTKDYVELPISSKKQHYGMKGFGYDSVSDNYKVVTKSVNEYSRNVYVYNLRTNTGKQVSHSPYDHNDKSWLPGVFVNGFLHWVFSRHSIPIIVAFSLADENFSELASPYNEVDIVSALSEAKLVALGEKLAIFNKVKGYIWLMNEYGVQKSWTKIVVHAFNEIPMVRPKVYYDNGKVLLLTPDLLRIYDVEERTFCKSYDISYMNMSEFISAYAESLVSPKFS